LIYQYAKIDPAIFTEVGSHFMFLLFVSRLHDTLPCVLIYAWWYSRVDLKTVLGLAILPNCHKAGFVVIFAKIPMFYDPYIQYDI